MTQAPPPPAYTGGPAPLNPADEKTWAIVVHITGVFFWFIPSLVAYLGFRGRGPFLEAHAKAALNFQISWTLWSIALGIISIVTLGIGAVLYFPFGIAFLVFAIIAAVKASQGSYYNYPLTIAFIK